MFKRLSLELGGKNPNVMYELGVRLAISNAPVILFREENPENQRIFDIAGFYAFEFRPSQYRKLEDYIIGKLRKFETADEVYESPILKLLRTEPTVVREVNRRRVGTMFESMRGGIIGLERAFLGALTQFLEARKFEPMPPDSVKNLLDFVTENQATLLDLDWSELAFRPNPVPALNAYLVDYPLTGLAPRRVQIVVNTLLAEYYDFFLSTDHAWRPPTYPVILSFAGESWIADQVAQAVELLLRTSDEAIHERLTDFIMEKVGRSVFDVQIPED